MDIGYIDPKYQNTNYIYNYKVNMLGLAPINTDNTNKEIIERSFLYQFVT